VKSLISLWSCTAEELAVRCHTSAARDITTVASRTEHEGLSFLGITLADYGKSFQRWLDVGSVDPSDLPAFRRAGGDRTGFPAFLQGFLGRVFDAASGALLDQPDIESIYAIRQLTLMFSKIALSQESLVETPLRLARSSRSVGANRREVVSPKRERAAMSEYVQCEQDVRTSDSFLDPSYMDDFKRMSEMLFGRIFSYLDSDIRDEQIFPKHGPGVVADKLSSNEKWNLRSWPSRLEPFMRSSTYLFPNRRHWLTSEGGRANILEPDAEIPVRVITVPKTLKTPRIIAIEPAAMQYAQQGIYRRILEVVKEDSFLYHAVGFEDQEPNRALALKGSFDGTLATLDLSEASDRVSNQLVRTMTLDYPHLFGAVQGSRSRKADVPGHGVIRLAKFASMGSALCFPFEAFVFLTVALLGIERELSAPLSRNQAIRLFSGQVRVFGDDIIVPRDYVLSVVNELETFGFRVNVGKSFWTGRFRESCGKEYFDGTDVSITKVRRVLPTQRQDAEGVIAAVSLRNRLYWAGLWKSAAWMDAYLRRILRFFPDVAPSSPLLGRESAVGYGFQRLHPYHHSPLAKGYTKVAKPPLDHLEGTGALLKCLAVDPPLEPEYELLGLRKRERLPVDDTLVDSEHLERSGRPKRVGIKLGWASPY